MRSAIRGRDSSKFDSRCLSCPRSPRVSFLEAAAGVDPARFSEKDSAAIRARDGLRDRLVVGLVGRQVTPKGVPTLIDAMKSVWRRAPEATLLLGGQSAHRESRVNEMLAALSGADIASTRCIVEPGVNGLTAPPYDVPALAERIVELLRDPAKRRAFGESGRAKVLARYTWDRVTDVWEAALAKAGRS